MASVEINLTCNLQTPVKVQYIDGNMFSLDNAGNTINVDVFNGEEPAELGGSVAVSVIRSDGATVAVSGAISGNKAYAILPQSCYAVPGVVSVVVKNVQNTTVTTLAAFVANVYQTSTDTTVDPGTIIPSVTALIAQIDAAVGSIPADYSGLLATIAADYSPSKAYPTVGAYAWCNGVLRRSIVPIPTAETYNAAHWTDAVIGDDISNLKSAIINEVTTYTQTPWVLGRRLQSNGTTINPSGSAASSGYAYILAPCKKNDKFKITAKGNHAFGVVFTDSTYTVKQTITPEDMTNKIAYAEQNGYILCNTSDQTQMELIRLETYTDLKEEVQEIEGWEDDIFGSDLPVVDLGLVQGYYLSSGFGGETSTSRWRTANPLPAGTYEITVNSSNYVFYWVEYVSDSSGTVIINSRNSSISYTGQNPFYLTFSRMTATSGTTAEEINSVFTVRKRQTNNSIEARVERLYSRHNIVFMGDSLFGMERGQYSVPLLCGYYTGATAYNCAIGGSAAHGHTNAFQYFDLDNLTDAIIAGDFTDQIAHEEDTGIPEYVPDVIDQLQAIDFKTINLLVISIGTNDWSMAFGTNAEIVANIEAIVNKMLTAFPQMRIMLMAPTYRFFMDESHQFVDDSDTHENANGSTLKSLVDQYSDIREDCHIPVVFPYYDLGIGRYNRSQWFITNDGTHPNEQGRFELAKFLSEYLRRMLYR